jgi:hypothetical protein
MCLVELVWGAGRVKLGSTCFGDVPRCHVNVAAWHRDLLHLIGPNGPLEYRLLGTIILKKPLCLSTYLQA